MKSTSLISPANENAGKLKRIAIEADAGDQPMPDPCRWRKARADCLFGENDRHEQHADNGANPEKLFKEKTAKGCIANQNRDGDGESHRPRDKAQEVEPTPLLGDLRAEKYRRSPRVLPKRHNSTPSMIAPDQGGKPAHCDGDRQGCPDNVVEGFEKADYGDDAGKADRRADETVRCPVVELRQAPVGACRSKQAARYARRRGDANHRLAGGLHEGLQPRIGEIKGLEHEADDDDHRGRRNHDDERDPPSPEDFMKTARLLDCQIAREDAPGQPRKRNIKQDDQR